MNAPEQRAFSNLSVADNLTLLDLISYCYSVIYWAVKGSTVLDRDSHTKEVY